MSLTKIKYKKKSKKSKKSKRRYRAKGLTMSKGYYTDQNRSTYRNNLGCQYSNETEVINFVAKIFWDLLIKMETYKDKTGSILDKYKKFFILKQQGDIIEQAGFYKQDVNNLFKIIKNTIESSEKLKLEGKSLSQTPIEIQYNKYFELLYNYSSYTNPDGVIIRIFPIYIILGILYNLIGGARSLYYDLTINDPELLDSFMIALRELFDLPESFKVEDFEHIYNNCNTDNKCYMDQLVQSLIMNGMGCINSLYRRNLNYKDFIRLTRPKIEEHKIKLDECNRQSFIYAALKNELTDEKIPRFIYQADTWYNLKDTFFKKIFKEYNRKYIGGPSGSAILLYNLVFNFLKYPTTNNNLKLLYKILIVDYIPIFHSLPEILMSIIPEYKHVNDKIPLYTLDEDPLDYQTRLFKFLDNPN